MGVKTPAFAGDLPLIGIIQHGVRRRQRAEIVPGRHAIRLVGRLEGFTIPALRAKGLHPAIFSPTFLCRQFGHDRRTRLVFPKIAGQKLSVLVVISGEFEALRGRQTRSGQHGASQLHRKGAGIVIRMPAFIRMRDDDIGIAHQARDAMGEFKQVPKQLLSVQS